MSTKIQVPVSLTKGLPTPETIRKQRDAYAQMLDQQLAQGMRVLQAQVKNQTEYLRAQAEQQKNQFHLQIDMEVKQGSMQLAQNQAEQTIDLQQQASQERQRLEAQAMMLGMEYQKKKAEEDMRLQQYEMENQQHEVQNRLTAEMHKLGVSIPTIQGSGPSCMMPNTLGLSHFGLTVQNISMALSPIKEPLFTSSTYSMSPVHVNQSAPAALGAENSASGC